METREDIIWKIEDKLIECDTLEEAENALGQFGRLKFCDEKIDDGVTEDDSEDEYVMMRSYDLFVDGEVLYIRLYYGNNTFDFGTFDIR